MDKQIRSRIKLTNPWHFLALGFGSGLAPFMPGTFGTLAGLPFLILIDYIPMAGFAALTAVFAVLGISICEKTAKDMKVHDHGAIVWDEIVGIMLTFLWIPLSLPTIVAGFVLFRLFDILKPWPISLLDRNVSGGLGIMVDDVFAGIFACGCLHALVYYSVL
ncbi:phosphatidylglycerophosphatase A [Alteromonas sp. 5E99-2]|uniref:phosphatidylglycerophosphatase A n=1 Tax=Alteromonas sp. 5E99-2 TaxID=2817683 RepID=UPI001A985E7C|nr:phosphatidylglycerophosphatase A [Alteromonas sp. 5E99-2]